MTIPAANDITERLKKLVPPYAVILHNDDVNSMEDVVSSIVKCVPSVDSKRAEAIMLEAHNTGRAVVIVCPLEQAELYRDRLQSCKLTVTIEKATD